MKKNSTLVQAREKQSLVKIITSEESGGEVYRGFVVGLSDQFIATLDILEWHIDGLRIYPLCKISECIRGVIQEKDQEILDWNGANTNSNYEWVKLGSFEEMFLAFRAKNKTVVVVYDGIAAVGEVRKAYKDRLDLKGFDPSGAWEDDITTIRFDEISHIHVDDEYSSVLRAYADVSK